MPDVQRELTEGEAWTREQLATLLAARFGPRAVAGFVAASQARANAVRAERPELHQALRTIGLFDLVINNGDRKSGHCLLGEDGRIWAIDHGLCLHEEPKLRTVIWDFAGQPVPAERLDDVGRLAAAPPSVLDGLLAPDEIDALRARAAAVLRRPVFPMVTSGRAYPWPLV